MSQRSEVIERVALRRAKMKVLMDAGDSVPEMMEKLGEAYVTVKGDTYHWRRVAREAKKPKHDGLVVHTFWGVST